MGEAPKVLFIKQTVAERHWFIELGEDVSERIGPCLMIVAAKSDMQLGHLTIRSATPYDKSTEVKRIWTWLKYALEALWHTWRTPGKPLLFIVTQSPFLPLIGYLCNRIWGQRYVLWVDDVHPEQFTRLGRLKDDGWVARLWRGYNRIVFQRADRIFVLGECMAQTLASSLSQEAQNRVVIVPTWVDVAGIKPLPKSENWFAGKYEQLNKLTFLYSGNLGHSHDLSAVIKAAKELQNYPDIHFMIIGEGPRWDKWQTLITQYGLKNVTLLPFQPVETLPYSLTTGEVAIVTLGNGIEGVSMPSKTYYAMSAGSAVIGLSHPPSDLQRVIEHYQCGMHVESGDVPGFVVAVKRFHSDRVFLDACRQNARISAVNEFSRSVNVERILNQIMPLLEIDKGIGQ